MAGGAKLSFDQVVNAMKTLSPARRVVLGLVVLGVPLAFILLILRANEPDLGLLFSQLREEDAALVVDRLREQKIPFRLASGGSAVFVPADRVYELRLQLAAEGLPKGGGAGFELIDRMPMGSTGFVQRLNYVRGLQGEMARTIQHLDAVEAARVHIVLPKKSLFLEEERPPTASVLLRLRSGTRLSKRQISGITYLVARGVEGLDPANVTLVDVNGNVLNGGRGDTVDQITGSQLEFKLSFERDLERRIQSMLEKVAGPQNVIVRVAAELDFRQVEETKEAFDPEGAVVRSEQRDKDASRTPGSRPAASAAERAGSEEGARASREKEVTNFEISKTIRRVREPVGRPKKISVAVLLGTPKPPEGEAKAAAPPALDDDRLAQVKTLVRTAIGFNSERGDQVEVVHLPYDLGASAVAAGLELEGSGGLGLSLWPALIRYGAMVLVGALVLLFFVRPMLRWATGRDGRMEEIIQFPKTVGELETELEGEVGSKAALGPARAGELAQKQSVKERLLKMAKDEPDRVLSVTRNWMQDQS